MFAHGEIVIGWFFLMLLFVFGLGITSIIVGFSCRHANWTWLILAVVTLLSSAPLAYLALPWTSLLHLRPPASLAPGQRIMIWLMVLLGSTPLVCGLISLCRWFYVKRVSPRSQS